MQTPIFDFVQQYQQGGTARFHMPGHKGKAFLGCESLDITEIEGADNLQHPEIGGIIAQSEQNATALFGTAHTYYSAGGSSACISAMLYLAKCAAPADCKGRILAGRNAHKVFMQACALLDIQPSWLYPAPQDAQGLCSCIITPNALGNVLAAQCKQNDLPMAVYITSPDYLGNLADVAGLVAVCAQYGLPLLVDNAHGAYLKFLQPSQHPMDLGAAMCADSAHKTLPVLTGGAYLHIGNAVQTLRAGEPRPYDAAESEADTIREQTAYPDAKAALSLFSSTSPSYLILQSLDLCNAYLSKDYPAALADCVAAVEVLKEELRTAGYCVCESEPLKITIDCRAGGVAIADVQGTQPLATRVAQNGEALAEHLRTQGIEVEFADPDFLVCMITPQNTAGELERLKAALVATKPVKVGSPHPQDVAQAAAETQPALTPQMAQIHPRATTHTLREALFSTGVEIPVENAAGRTCRLPSVSCPPAIPIVVSGEVITASDIALFQYYGIKSVNVIKEL